MLSTPPRLRPGEAASFRKRTGTSTVTRASLPTRMKSTWIGKVANGIELHAARDHPRLLAVDVEGEDGALEMAGMELLRDRAVVDGDGLAARFLSP